MNWLLKIVEGPMKGAEIALLGGRRTSFGSGDECDIVIADMSLAEKAFELDVSDTLVTLIGNDGEARELRRYEVETFGTTAIAVGPADERWGDLVYKKPEENKEETPAEENAESEEQQSKTEESVPLAEEAEEQLEGKKSKARGCLKSILWFVIIVLLIGIATFLAWYLRARIKAFVPQSKVAYACARVCVEKTTPYVKSGWSLTKRTGRKVADWSVAGWNFVAEGTGIKEPEVIPEKTIPLDEIAEQYSLTLTECEGVSRLKGNVKRRTERLAIRALALASDPNVELNLTDDESLVAAANELLFVVTEGQLKATSASNRIVTVEGYSRSAADFERCVRALSTDVPAIEQLVTSGVRIGGKPPAKDDVVSAPEPAEEKVQTQASVKMAVRRDYPIAGILAKPYPCVVLRDGMRLAEGAQVGTAVIIRINADSLVLKEGQTEFEWRP